MTKKEQFSDVSEINATLQDFEAELSSLEQIDELLEAKLLVKKEDEDGEGFSIIDPETGEIYLWESNKLKDFVKNYLSQKELEEKILENPVGGEN